MWQNTRYSILNDLRLFKFIYDEIKAYSFYLFYGEQLCRPFMILLVNSILCKPIMNCKNTNKIHTFSTLYFVFFMTAKNSSKNPKTLILPRFYDAKQYNKNPTTFRHIDIIITFTNLNKLQKHKQNHRFS